jgi:hypothetical protein
MRKRRVSDIESTPLISSNTVFIHDDIQDPEYASIRRALDLARREINRQNAALALPYLRFLTDEVARPEGSPAWAEHALLTGEAYLAMRDDVAGSFLSEALTRISKRLT